MAEAPPKSPTGPTPAVPSGATGTSGAHAIVARALPNVDLAELPDDVRARLLARAEATRTRAGRLSVGRYVVVGELGRGGMGVVYDAWDPRIDRRVAVKTIEPDLVPDERERDEVVQRFLREIKVVGKLQHPNIVTVFDYGEDPPMRRGETSHSPGRILFYVMEYLEGRSLSRVLKERKPLPDLEAVRVGLDVALGLSIAHQRGVIHRDIKPSNIFIRRDGHAVILDFGIAKVGQEALTRQGQILGTPTYLAPERLREKEDGLDGRADLFSLGVLLYTMVAGEAPFTGQNVYDLIDNIQQKAHDRLRRSTPGGLALARAIDHLLAKRPEERTPSAEQAIAELREAERWLEKSTPDVSDLGAGLVVVGAGDGVTELATPSEPFPALRPGEAAVRDTSPDQGQDARAAVDGVRSSARPSPSAELPPSSTLRSEGPRAAARGASIPRAGAELGGTSPELALSRSTRRIDLASELGDADAWSSEATAEDMAALEGTAVDAPSPRVLSRRASSVAAANGGSVSLKQSASVLEQSLGEARRVLGRRASSIEGETVAEDAGAAIRRLRASDPGHAELATEAAVPLAPPEPTLGVRARRRPRIEASLVDEDDVVVRPASLDAGSPDEVPTHAGQRAPREAAAPLAVSLDDGALGDDFEAEHVEERVPHVRGDDFDDAGAQMRMKAPGSGTDLIRPRRPRGDKDRALRPSDPAERDDAGRVALAKGREEPRARAREAADPSERARPSGDRAPAPQSRGKARADDVRAGLEIDASNLTPEEQAKIARRRRAVVVVAAALASVALGLSLARWRTPAPAPIKATASAPASAAPSPPSAGELQAVAADVEQVPMPDVVAPRSPSEIFGDAERLEQRGELGEADRLYARVLDAVGEEHELYPRALLGRGRVLVRSGERDRAERFLRRVVELRGEGAEVRAARSELDAIGRPYRGEPRPRSESARAPAGEARASAERGAPEVRAPEARAPEAKALQAEPAERAVGRSGEVEVRDAPPVSPRSAPQPLPGDDDGGERECRQLLRDHIDDTEAAIRAFEALRGRRPSAPCAHKQLGIFYKRAGQDRAALDAWRRYLELKPDAPDRAAIQGKIDALEQRLGGR